MLNFPQQVKMISAWIQATNSQKGVTILYAGHQATKRGLLCKFFVLSRPTKEPYGELLVEWPIVKEDAHTYGFDDIVAALNFVD